MKSAKVNLVAALLLVMGASIANAANWTLDGVLKIEDNVFNVVGDGSFGFVEGPVLRPARRVRVEIFSRINASQPWVPKGALQARRDGTFVHTLPITWLPDEPHDIRLKVTTYSPMLAVVDAVSVPYRYIRDFYDVVDGDTLSWTIDPANIVDQRGISMFVGAATAMDALSDRGTPMRLPTAFSYPSAFAPQPEGGFANHFFRRIEMGAEWFRDPIVDGSIEHIRFANQAKPTRDVIHELMHFWHFERVAATPQQVVLGMFTSGNTHPIPSWILTATLPLLMAPLPAWTLPPVLPLSINTHEARETEFCGFAEGFAEWSGRRLLEEVWNASSSGVALQTRDVSFADSILAVDSPAGDIIHRDNGVENALFALQSGDWFRRAWGFESTAPPADFTVTHQCEPLDFSTTEILRVLDAQPIPLDKGLLWFLDRLRADHPARIDEALVFVALNLAHGTGAINSGVGEPLDQREQDAFDEVCDSLFGHDDGFDDDPRDD